MKKVNVPCSGKIKNVCARKNTFYDFMGTLALVSKDSKRIVHMIKQLL